MVILKSAVAATLAWYVASTLMQAQSPAFAPFSAVLMVQVTVYQSVVQSLRYVLAVAVGVGVQAVLGFSAGPDIVTFGLVAVAALAISRWRALGAQGAQVATAAFFAFSAFIAAPSTPGRLGALGEILLLVLVGCAIGILINVLVVPPMRYRSAEYGVRALAGALSDIVGDIAPALQDNELGGELPAQWHYRATRIGFLVDQANSAVQTSSESGYFNPRKLLRNRHPTFTGYQQLVVALERVSIQVASVTRTLEHGREDYADRTDSEYRGFVRRYGDFLASVGEVTQLLSKVDEDRLDAQSAQVCEAVETARAAHERLATEAHERALSLAGSARSYGVLLVDSDRLMDDLQLTCDVLQECAEQERHIWNRRARRGR